MTQSSLTKLKGDTITLPKPLAREWRGADVFMHVANDTVILKKVYAPGRIFDPVTEERLKRIGKKITKKDIDAAVAWARKQAYASRV